MQRSSVSCLWFLVCLCSGSSDSAPNRGRNPTFNLSLPGERFEGLNWAVDSRWLAFICAALLAFLGGWVLRRSHVKWTNLALAIGLGLFVLAFLTWAASGKSFNLVGMLRSTVILSVPVTLGALTGLMCERVAVINIAIEGQLLTAAFVGTIVGSAWGIWAGLISAMLTGALLGAVLAVLAIKFRIDQIIAGVVINIFALGLTSFLRARVLSEAPDLNSPGRFASFKIPVLGRHSDHRADVLRPQLVRVRHLHPGRSSCISRCSTRGGVSGLGRSVSTLRQRIR